MRDPVRLEALSFAWPGGASLFQGLSLDAPAGSITALVGASGCGKSTVLRLLAGLLSPAAGRVSGVPEARAFVFQSPTLLPWRTVADNVGLPLELAGVAAEARGPRVAEALARVGLADVGASLPRQLSGGMRMRASIARALVTRPQLLLLDEPFSALDPLTRRRVRQEFLALWSAEPVDARATVVVVSHDLDEAALIADRVIVLAGSPARVVETVEVGLPRPREDALLHDPALGAIAARLEALL